MGSESTLRFEVTKPKSRKRTKKKEKSKDHTNKTDASENDGKETERFTDKIAAHKRRGGRKRKANRKFNGTDEKLTNTEEESNLISTEGNEDEKSDDEATPPKKFGKANTIHADNDQEESEETDKNDKKTPKEPSKRQIKREKAEKRENDKREASRLEAIKKALNYVSKWKHAKSEWKFEKLRQIWLIENLLDKNSIPDDIFPTVLEYFEGCKGMAREQLLKKGMDVIRKAEEDEENRDEIIESVAYKRARQLLQGLPTET